MGCFQLVGVVVVVVGVVFVVVVFFDWFYFQLQVDQVGCYWLQQQVGVFGIVVFDVDVDQ